MIAWSLISLKWKRKKGWNLTKILTTVRGVMREEKPNAFWVQKVCERMSKSWKRTLSPPCSNEFHSEKYWRVSAHSLGCCLLLLAVERNKTCIPTIKTWISDHRSDFVSLKCSNPVQPTWRRWENAMVNTGTSTLQ